METKNMGAVDQIKNRSFSTEKRVVRFELPVCPPASLTDCVCARGAVYVTVICYPYNDC